MADAPESQLPIAARGEAADVTQDDKTMAALAHASVFVAGFLGPLFIYIAYKDRSAFVRFHAQQALIFQGVGAVAIILISLVTCGLGSILILPLFILEGLHAVKAYEGEWKAYPYMENIGR